MQKRAKKRGKYPQYQKLFNLHRGKLARVILDNLDTLQCEILTLSIQTSEQDGKHLLSLKALSPSTHMWKLITPCVRP